MSLEEYTNIKLLVENETYTAIKNQVICPICYCVKINPKMCQTCQNSICGNCFKSLKSCPFKCGNFDYKDCRIILDLLSGLSFKCNNGCGEIINFDNLINHYENECKKIDFKQKYEMSQRKIAELIKEIGQLKNEKQKQSQNNSNPSNIVDRNNQDNIQQNDHRPIKRAPALYDIKSIFHPHPIIYRGNDYPSRCNICNKRFPVNSTFNCKLCKFDLCDDCIDYPNNPIIFNKSIHEHPVTYRENRNGICYKCSNEINKGFYCRQCDQYLCEGCQSSSYSCNIF